MKARFTRVAPLLLLAGCLEFSPHALPTDDDERDLHAKTLAALPSAGDGSLVVAALGDTQTHYDEAEDAVDAINARGDVDLVVQLGDLTDLGTLDEFRAMHSVLDGLQAPWLVVVGNHDLLGNGRRIYERMFGPVNTAFTFGGTRFLLRGTRRGWRPLLSVPCSTGPAPSHPHRCRNPCRAPVPC